MSFYYSCIPCVFSEWEGSYIPSLTLILFLAINSNHLLLPQGRQTEDKVPSTHLFLQSSESGSHLTSRSVCIFLPRLVYIPELSLIPRQVPDFNEQTRVSNGHPRCKSRIYPSFLPQLEKTHETFPSLRDEARFPCIVSRAIAFSQSNM